MTIHSSQSRFVVRLDSVVRTQGILVRISLQATLIAATFGAFLASASAGDNAGSTFARSMIVCSAKNSVYALGPGDASVAAAAAPKSGEYLKAAVDAAGQAYVDTETPKIKQEALATILGQLQDGNTGDPMTLWQTSVKECDDLLGKGPNG